MAMLDAIYIDETALLLNTFAETVRTLGKLNLHDSNIHAEDFFRDFLNTLKGWNLINANSLVFNVPGVDLIYEDDSRMVQVTSTVSKKKIQDSLDKTNKKKYSDYHFYFLVISRDATNIVGKEYSVPEGFVFDAASDIWDISRLVAMMKDADIETKKSLHDLTRKHLGIFTQPAKNAHSLSEVVKVLSEEMQHGDDMPTKVSFIVSEKIKVNQLEGLKGSISESAGYTTMLNSVYDTHEQFGSFTRRTIHSVLRKVYEDKKGSYTQEELYRHICKYAYNIVLESANRPTDLMMESIEWCVDVIVTDAFEACKIFDHPQNLI